MSRSERTLVGSGSYGTVWKQGDIAVKVFSVGRLDERAERQIQEILAAFASYGWMLPARVRSLYDMRFVNRTLEMVMHGPTIAKTFDATTEWPILDRDIRAVCEWAEGRDLVFPDIKHHNVCRASCLPTRFVLVDLDGGGRISTADQNDMAPGTISPFGIGHGSRVYARECCLCAMWFAAAATIAGVTPEAVTAAFPTRPVMTRAEFDTRCDDLDKMWDVAWLKYGQGWGESDSSNPLRPELAAAAGDLAYDRTRLPQKRSLSPSCQHSPRQAKKPLTAMPNAQGQLSA